MPLHAVTCGASCADRRVIRIAAGNRPSLVIDCANALDPHSLRMRQEEMQDIYVINAEAIYRFRDALRKSFYWADRLGVRLIAVTTIHTLFSYDDPEENYNVLEHCWEIMHHLGQNRDVYVAVAEGTIHEKFAERFADNRLNMRGR